MRTHPCWIGLLALASACGGSGSGDGPTAPTTPTVARLEIVGIPKTNVMVNDSLTFQVRATVAGGAPASSAPLAIAASSGAPAATSVLTGTDGIASIKWRTAGIAGLATVTVSAANGPSVAYSATVDRSIVGRWLGPITSTTPYHITIQRHDVPDAPSFFGYNSPTNFSTTQNASVYGSTNGANVSLSIQGPGLGTVSFVGTLSPDGSKIDGTLTDAIGKSVATFQKAP